MTKHNPQMAIANAEAAICEAINQAKKVADKYGLSFEINPARGMGGTYYSPGALQKDKEHCEGQGAPEWSILEQHSYYVSETEGGWVSSSMEC